MSHYIEFTDRTRYVRVSGLNI